MGFVLTSTVRGDQFQSSCLRHMSTDDERWLVIDGSELTMFVQAQKMHTTSVVGCMSSIQRDGRLRSRSHERAETHKNSALLKQFLVSYTCSSVKISVFSKETAQKSHENFYKTAKTNRKMCKRNKFRITAESIKRLLIKTRNLQEHRIKSR